MLFQKTPNPPIERWTPTPEEWNVYILCNGQLGAEEIAARTGRSLEDTRRVLARLLQAGLIYPVDDTAYLRSRLGEVLRQQLGDKAKPYLDQLAAAEGREALKAAALKISMKLKLTVSKKIGDSFEEAVRKLGL
jgi:predicted ArsR family transcriptional regulator